MAQAPRIADINLYGLQKTTADRVLAVLHARPGDPLPPSKGALEDELEKMPGVVLGRIEAVCCEGADAILFVGVEERNAPHPAFRTPPAGEATLPEGLADVYRQYLAAVARAARGGSAAEDLTAGHSRMADPGVRAIQDRFAAFADEHLAQLREVLSNAAEPEQRAIAATVIGYASNKKEVALDLQQAMRDPDDAVRGNAMRALRAFAVARIPLSATWLVELLHSIVLSDRIESTRVLLTLTDRPNWEALDLIRSRALGSLVEMAQWKTPRYALPPFMLLGRAGGLTDAQTQSYWASGNRTAVIQKALTAAAARRSMTRDRR